MSEELGLEGPTAEASVERTGHPVVDDVLDGLEGLDDVAVTDQVPVFESAHERLRSALTDAGTDAGDESPA